MGENNLFIEESNLFEKLCSQNVLRIAFMMVEKNKGAPGIDGITIKQFKNNIEKELNIIQEELITWTYQPEPVRGIDIPKPAGGTRLLGIPCIRDRVVQAAMKLLLEPLFEPQFSNNSYGFRPGRNQQQAVKRAQMITRSGKEFIVDIDLEKFFDGIQHNKLISRMRENIKDTRILRLIGIMLRSGIMKDGLVKRTQEGTTQGSPLSPLLSNIVLDQLDKELENRGLEFCRFADDCNIFVRTEKAARRVMQTITKFIEKKLKLTVNKDKSKIARTNKVKFLGMTIVAMTLAISQQSINAAMAKVKELTPRGTYMTLDKSIDNINQWYMGWSAYYRMTQYPAQLMKIEAHIRRRIRSRIVDQQKQKRNLANKLINRGVPSRLANKTAYSHRGRWALSHTRAVERAYPNKWFIEEMGLKIRSNEKHKHWFG
ncbi:MAG: group II intron reverse transcriptase/maturase [Planctomycetia bacterium]|nr:group II intron reverse transcriptase/maturase [Planctomycetia bacterium]